MAYFEYGEKEMEYLKKKDKKLKEVIEQIGMIYRKIDDDLFGSLMSSIIGQQISSKAAETVTQRLLAKISAVTPENVNQLSLEELQSIGITMKKAGYMKEIARRIVDQEFSLDHLYSLNDEEVIELLSSLPGVGRWTAEMLMLFCMKRMDILSYSDLAIIRGMKNLYHHQEIDKKRFLQYKKRYSPYGSVASLYLWELSKK